MIDGVDIMEDDAVINTKWYVKYGSLVTVEIEDDKAFTFEIVGTGEVDVTSDPMKLSFESAVVSAVQDKKKWDVVVAKLPHGKKNVHILDVK
jgi:transcription elongation GreA/GreB family factor